jgi:hypothetical protein
MKTIQIVFKINLFYNLFFLDVYSFITFYILPLFLDTLSPAAQKFAYAIIKEMTIWVRIQSDPDEMKEAVHDWLRNQPKKFPFLMV